MTPARLLFTITSMFVVQTTVLMLFIKRKIDPITCSFNRFIDLMRKAPPQ